MTEPEEAAADGNGTPDGDAEPDEDLEEPPPERVTQAFETHDRFEPTDGGYGLTTTEFESRVTASATDEGPVRYTVTVRVPMLSSAVRETVGQAVEEGWFETLELRLADATDVTRHDLTLEEYAFDRDGTEAVTRYVFEWGNADSAPDVARALVEYVEGTYLQGVVPGYEYRDPVAGMLARARQSDGDGGDDTGGPMPL